MMKPTIIFLMIIALLTTSCGGVKKSGKHTPAQMPETVVSDVPEVKEQPAEPPIVEVEEKLVPVNETPPDPYRYFVIIGSFRNPDNASRYQEQISGDGFTSTLLRNAEGLIRVAVMGTDNINTARAEIKRIREAFPKYSDTWLLIQKM